MIYGLALILALYGIVIGIYCLFTAICICVPRLSQWLRSGKWKEDVEGWREKKVGRLWRIERVDRMWKILLERRRSAGWKAEDVDAEEELERLGGRNDGEESEGSVGGETLFEGEEDDDDDNGDGQARKKKEDMGLDTKD